MVAPQADPSDFTPLMSPAMTPLEHSRQYQQSMPEVGLPGTAYFSPLSSPVIEQQQQQQSQQQRRFRQRSGHQTPVLGPSSTASRVTKVQPGSAPSGGKRSLSTASMPSPRTGPNGAGGGGGGTSSSESISPPEIVPDISMPPPPPQVKRETNSSKARNQSTVPVTPSSLMNLAPAGNSRSRSGSSSSSTTVSEDKVNSALRATANASSSRPSSRRSSSVASGSSNASPHIRPRPPSISPAIRPRLSPGTSPTIAPERVAIYPSSGKDDLSALLASKSNYQNIVEGKHSQLGLQYPEQLSAELTSKRTSHKLAEQGRRNRINVALQELADLVAPNAAVNSKANTVETAIKYIKRLQAELDTAKEKLAQYEKAQPKDN